MKEKFKNIDGYFGDYQVSNMGNVKSFKRINEKLLNPSVDNLGYYALCLSKNNIAKTFRVHQLVAMAFLNHVPCGYDLVVDHVDRDRLNNNIDNLRVITQRENSDKRHINSTSNYRGVRFDKKIEKWKSSIYINGKPKYLGSFDTEIEASIYYENAVKSIKDGIEIKIKRKKFSSKYKGVCFIKSVKKWRASIRINYKLKHIGHYITELEAHNAYQTELTKLK